MRNITVLTGILLLACTSFATANSPVESQFHYGSSVDQWAQSRVDGNNHVLFSMVFFNTKGEAIYHEGSPATEMDVHVSHLDVLGYWQNKQNDRRLVAVSKVAYIVDASPQLFNPQRLGSLEFLQKTVGDYEINAVSPRTFRIQGTVFSPSFTYDLEFFRHPGVPQRYRKGVEYTMNQDPALGTPFLTAVQHNYDYGRVLFHKTTEMSLSITNYYDVPGNRTLVVVYTLNYLHNIPPDLIGGERILVNEIKDMILDYVVRIRQVCAANGRNLSMTR